jgi:short-subunit dehydrogenase
MHETALVTGASSGLGEQLARLFARDGIGLVLVARREDRLRRLKSELERDFGIAVNVLPADLTSPRSVGEVLELLDRRKIEIDYLVNNAGFGQSDAFADVPLERSLEQIDLNVRALTELTRRLLPAMIRKRRGRILNLGSTAGDQPGPFMAVYYATKAYVNSFSEALHHELEATGVTVTLSCPGPTFTEFPKVSNVKNMRLFRMNAMAPDRVAAEAYRAMMKGTRRITHGARNKLGSQLSRLLPRSAVLAIVSRLNAPG